MKKYFIVCLLATSTLVFGQSSGADSLSRYLEIAGRNNPVVKSDFLAYQAALQKIPQIGAWENPQLEMGFFLSPMELVEGRQIAQFQLMQMFPWFGTRKAARTEAEYMAQMAFEQFRETRDNLFLEVYTQWYVLCSLRQKLVHSNNNLTLLKQLEALTLRKYASPTANSGSGVAVSAKPSASASAQPVANNMAGMSGNNGSTQPAASESMATMGNSGAMSNSGASMSDVLRICLETVELENNIESILSEIKAEKAKFNALLNRDAKSEVNIPDSFAQTPFLLDITSVIDDMTRQNPMLEMITQESLAYKAKGEMDKKMSYPMFGAGLQYMLIKKNSMSSMNGMNGKDMIMPMVAVSIPVYRNKYKAQQRESEFLQQSAQERYTNTLNNLTAELYRNKHRLNDAERKIALYQKQEELARSTFHLLTQEFISGKSDLTNIIQVQRQLLDYQLKKSEAIAGYNTMVANIQKMISNKGDSSLVKTK
jgi:outer membrane protein TolC